jgi:predicted esterase
MPPHEHHLTVTRTARYYTLGPLAGAPRQRWFVCHGFAQLAGRFIRHFETLDDGTRVIIAPEALSRFYLEAAGGRSPHARVGATWMTREDRLAEIGDYVSYLDSLVTHMDRQLQHAGGENIALGFSQGAATASRWVAFGHARIDRLILWGGAMPPDLDLGAAAERLARVRIQIVLGSQDEYAGSAEVTGERRRLEAAGIPYELVEYDGGHALEAGTLARIAG